MNDWLKVKISILVGLAILLFGVFITKFNVDHLYLIAIMIISAMFFLNAIILFKSKKLKLAKERPYTIIFTIMTLLISIVVGKFYGLIAGYLTWGIIIFINLLRNIFKYHILKKK